MLGDKVSVGPKWSWGQTGCEPFFLDLVQIVLNHFKQCGQVPNNFGPIEGQSIYLLLFFPLDLIAELNEVFLKLVYAWDQDPRASRILRQIMEYVSNHRKNMLSSKSYMRKVDFLRREWGE